MIYAILSAIFGAAIFLGIYLLFFPVYIIYRDEIRKVLKSFGLDSFSFDEKVRLGMLKENPLTKAVSLPSEPGTVRSNCILSSDQFPNIGKYFSDYKETVVPEEKEVITKDVNVKKDEPNIFSGMTIKMHLRMIQDLKEKKSKGKLSFDDESLLAALDNVEAIESTKSKERFLKLINNY